MNPNALDRMKEALVGQTITDVAVCRDENDRLYAVLNVTNLGKLMVPTENIEDLGIFEHGDTLDEKDIANTLK